MTIRSAEVRGRALYECVFCSSEVGLSIACNRRIDGGRLRRIAAAAAAAVAADSFFADVLITARC